MTRMRVFIRARNGDVIGQLDELTQLDLVLRRNNVSSWSINCPPTTKALALAEAGAGLVVERDGAVLMSGLRSDEEQVWDVGQDQVIVSGVSDDVHLWDYNIWPSALTAEGDGTYTFAGGYSDDITDDAETAMHHYVNNHLRDAARAIPTGPSFTLASNLARGATVVRAERLSILGDTLSSIADQSAALGGARLNFGIKENQFYVTQAADRRAEQVFSKESGNLAGLQFKNSAPTGTHVLVAGQNEGTARVIVVQGDEDASTKWGRRIEVFKDMRGTAEPSELLNAATEELANRAEKSEVALRPIDRPNREYAKDWNLGDWVTVQDIESVVSEVRLTLDASGETIAPSTSSTSTASAVAVLKAFDAVRDLQRRLNRIERNY